MDANVVRRTMSIAAVLCMSAAGAGLEAQEDAVEFTWENATELSFVSTGGNASSNTLGLKTTLQGTGGRNIVKLELGGIRAETEFRDRTATGTISDFQVSEATRSELTAENYFARMRYDRTFGAAFGFGGAGWDRNTFAGVKNRFSFVAGAGRTWIESDAGRLKTDLGATYTIQKDVDPNPAADDKFLGVRASIEARRRLSASADLTSMLIVDENVEETGDLRGDWTNSLTVSISEGLALKTSLQLLFDEEPALIKVPLVDAGGVPTGTDVLTPGDKVDSILTLTLVIKL